MVMRERPSADPSKNQKGKKMNPRSAWHTARATGVVGALLIVLSGCGGSGSSRPSFDARRAKTLLGDYAARAKRTGVSAAVVRGDALLWSGATGTANKERNVAASDDSVYLIASVSKTVTAWAVMQLVEDGKLDLDADINTYLPFAIRNPKQTGAMITLRHLLTHTSGITDDYYGEVAFPTFYTKDADPVTPRTPTRRLGWPTFAAPFSRPTVNTTTPPRFLPTRPAPRPATATWA